LELKIDHKSPIPLHVQAEQLIRQLAQSPDYQHGKLLPNEVDLAKRLAISRATLRQAINKLVFEGLLVRKKGVGTRVVKKKYSSRANTGLVSHKKWRPEESLFEILSCTSLGRSRMKPCNVSLKSTVKRKC